MKVLCGSAHILWSIFCPKSLLRTALKSFLFQVPAFIFSKSCWSPNHPPLLTLKTESRSASKHCSAFRDARPCSLFSRTTRENADLSAEYERIDWFSVGCRDFTQKHVAIRIYFCLYSGLPRDSPLPSASSFVQPSLLRSYFSSLFWFSCIALFLCMWVCVFRLSLWRK